MSAAGEAFAMLPPMVARLRICREPKAAAAAAMAGSRPSSLETTSEIGASAETSSRPSHWETAGGPSVKFDKSMTQRS
jgi:hypothetical protein